MAHTPGYPRIVILGAGFAGVQCARELARRLPADQDGRITLVDRHNYLLFTPMLTEVAGGQVDTRHIVAAIRRLSSRITFVEGRVDEVDLRRRRITLIVGQSEAGIPEERRTLEAEQLVIALGSVTNFHDIDGLQAHALTVKSLGDAAMIRNRALALLERAGAEPDRERRRALLTFVVGGGGFSGVETMAALNDLVRDSVKYYPQIQAGDIRTILAHGQERLLPELSGPLAEYARQKLQRRGVEVLLNTRITGAGADYVELHSGRRIATHMLIWTAGVAPNPLVERLDCRRGKHGGIIVDACCAVPGYPGVWALGDCAEIPQRGGATYAPTAQNATREGRRVARNILAAWRGQPPRPFSYRPIGELAIVGKRTGVARLFGLRFSGFVAWWMWRTVYLLKLPTLGKRIRVAADWTLDLLFGREIEELPIARASTVPAESVEE
jgi:NADH dehydrogenase